MRIAFFGSDRFSVKCLEAFLKKRGGASVSIFHSVKARIPFARHFPELPVHVIPGDVNGSLRGWELPHPFDLGIVASFGFFIPRRIIEAFPLRMINAHPSLLPAYRGASPIQHTIMEGRLQSAAGVSIIEVHPTRMDAGRILLSERPQRLSSRESDSASVAYDTVPTFAELEGELGTLAGQLLARVASDLPHYLANATNQDESLVSLAPKIQKDHGFVSFREMSALMIFSRHRAISHHEPIMCNVQVNNDSYCLQLVSIMDPTKHPRPLSMGRTQFEDATTSCIPGSVFFDRQLRALWVMTATRDWLPLERCRLVRKPTVLDAGAIFNTLCLSNFKSFFL